MPPCVGFVSPLPAKGLGHKCICTWPGHAEHLRYPLRPVSFESSLACSEGLPSSQLFAPPAVTPPSPILGAGQHKDTGCSRRVFPFLPPASQILRTGWPQAHFSKFQLPSSKQQLSSPLSFILPPADSPVPKPRCLESHTSHSPPRSTHSFRLPQAPTASVFPPEMPPLVPQHHRVHPVQPQTRTRHQPGPFCAEGSTECWRELSRSRTAEQILLGKEAARKNYRRARCWTGHATPSALPWKWQLDKYHKRTLTAESSAAVSSCKQLPQACQRSPC